MSLFIAIGGSSQWIAPKGSALSVQIMNISLNLRVDKIQMPIPPLIFIPTTAGTLSGCFSSFVLLQTGITW